MIAGRARQATPCLLLRMCTLCEECSVLGMGAVVGPSTQVDKQDDQWVVPHNLCLVMSSPSSVNVLAFDPNHGADQARGSQSEILTLGTSENVFSSKTVFLGVWQESMVSLRCLSTAKPVVPKRVQVGAAK